MASKPQLISSFLLIYFCAIIASSSGTKRLPGVKPYFCSKCVAQSDRCKQKLAAVCGACKPAVQAHVQPESCIVAACRYCSRHGRSVKFPCNSNMISTMCAEQERTSFKANAPPPEPNEAIAEPHCIWRASDNAVVIPLADVRERGNDWTSITRDGERGIIYEKELGGGIDGPGEKGVMCFSVKAGAAGNYYMGAVSYAPHVTEHNDVWVLSTKGFNLWQGGELWRKAENWEWLKAYQNEAGWSEDFKTKDHDGHQFIIPDVGDSEMFELCISGRSYKYELYRLVIAKCSGGTCTGNIMRDITELEPSECIIQR